MAFDTEPQDPPPSDKGNDSGAKEHPQTIEDGMRIHGMHSESSGGKVYREAWGIAMSGEYPAHSSFQHLLNQDVAPFFAQQGWKDGRRVYESENSEQPNLEPQSPPATEEPAEDVPLLAAFGSYRARRNIPPRSGRGNYYRNGWCDAADALQVSMNLPDDPENGLRLAYLAGYNDYQEAAVMDNGPKKRRNRPLS